MGLISRVSSRTYRNHKMSEEELFAKVTAQGDKIRELKSAKAEKDAITAEVKVLLALKAEYKSVSGKDYAPAGSGSKKDKPKQEQKGPNLEKQKAKEAKKAAKAAKKAEYKKKE